jgi:DNA-binding transcriptional MerR regulator
VTIAEVAAKFDLSADTLRYYERVGLIPPVARTSSGLRDYREGDLRWVEFIKCMRSAGVSIEALVEYVALFRRGRDPSRAEGAAYGAAAADRGPDRRASRGARAP